MPGRGELGPGSQAHLRSLCPRLPLTPPPGALSPAHAQEIKAKKTPVSSFLGGLGVGALGQPGRELSVLSVKTVYDEIIHNQM